MNPAHPVELKYIVFRWAFGVWKKRHDSLSFNCDSDGLFGHRIFSSVSNVGTVALTKFSSQFPAMLFSQKMNNLLLRFAALLHGFLKLGAKMQLFRLPPNL